MTNPVPGYPVTTPYGKRGPHWSCNPDSHGNGVHTGADIAAPFGTPVVAARDGTVEYVNFGTAFGGNQLVVVFGDGTRDFYAHMSWRVANGRTVQTGDKVGEVGMEGNATGHHLHFERHDVSTGGWSCGVVVDPQPSLDFGVKDWRAYGDVYVEKLHKGQQDSDSVSRLRYRLEHHDKMPDGKKPGYGADYGDKVVEASRYWMRELDPKRDEVTGSTDGSVWGNGQANRLFGDNYTVIEKE